MSLSLAHSPQIGYIVAQKTKTLAVEDNPGGQRWRGENRMVPPVVSSSIVQTLPRHVSISFWNTKYPVCGEVDPILSS